MNVHCLAPPRGVWFSKHAAQPSPENYMDVVKIQTACGVVSLCNNRLHWLKYPNFACLFSLSMCICNTLATPQCFPLQSASLSLSACHSSTLRFGLLLASPSSVLSGFPRAFLAFISYTVDTLLEGDICLNSCRGPQLFPGPL